MLHQKSTTNTKRSIKYIENEGSPQLVPQLLSEPIQKLNEANRQRELPKTGTTKHRLC